ncbi:MAG TPA: hypothetical protein VGC79_26355, partial [Polyangiaceae bacterium]
QACSSDPADPVTTPTAGAAGAHTGAAGAVSAGGSSAGGPAAGAPSLGGGGAGGGAAGAPAGGAGAGGGPLGTGGGSAGSGSGGSSGGSAGHSAGGAGGGSSSTATYADVKAIFSSSCATNKCHDSASGHTNFKDGELHTTLTTALPSTAMFQMCKGTILATPGDAASSFIVKLVTGPGQSTCKNSGADSKVDRMPDKCGGAAAGGVTPPKCLTTEQINTLSSWIAANAPH